MQSGNTNRNRTNGADQAEIYGVDHSPFKLLLTPITGELFTLLHIHYITKHLLTETERNSMFCGPETVDVHQQSRVHKTYCFPEVSVNKYFVI